ncbi:MAG: nitric-oxide reductase large subunit [Planctomycetota bacterium]|nr:MAG: nitric-oxide reductase large subunit [Planctomycetota bacterium]
MKLSIGRVLLITTLLGFSILLLGGWSIYGSRAPIPGAVVTEGGETLFGRDQILGGQAVYQKYGLMDWGSVLGHGTYFGPDFTAELLHRRVELLRSGLAQNTYARRYDDLTLAERDAVDAAAQRVIKRNRYDDSSDTLTLPPEEVAAFEVIESELRKRFTEGEPDRALPAGVIKEEHLPATRKWVAAGDQIHQVSAFFWWTAWLAGAERPNDDTTYTNNWPYDEDAGNTVSKGAMLWSGVSVAVLLALLPLVILAYFKGRYWMEDAYAEGQFPKQELSWLPVYPSQRKTLKYFVIAGALFLVQTLLGGYMAHYYVDGSGFYGFDLSALLPFVVAKTWHLQLAIFWIATAWLGLGLYIAPLIGGREPRGQGLLVDILFGAVVLVAVGSLAGEWLGVQGMLGEHWWLLGHTGWELIELGLLWKGLLAVGFMLWLFIVARASVGALKSDPERAGLVKLFLIAAAAIPVMFCASFLITPGTHITMADYWRWWVIHLWVEGMFEVFAVVVVGLLFVNMGLVTRRSATRALQFQLIILLGSGLIGTGHHYYWIGSNDLWISLGSIFSGLEVIPLTLLAIEAVEHWAVMRKAGKDFAYKHVFGFLVAVAFWNLFGAGVLGFLINLPMVSYYEHGSFLTANHGHGALMGVFGMLAIALALYCVRNVCTEKGWNDKLFRVSFWGLNIGLLGMILLTLTPVGVIQLQHAAEHGFWSARSLEFYKQDHVQALLWMRMLPDMIFIGLGVVPLLLGLWQAFRNPRPDTPIEEPVREELRFIAPPLVQAERGTTLH